MEKSQKVAKKYCCIPCDYSSSNKTDYDKHLSTQKHFWQSEAMNYDVKVAKSRKTSMHAKCVISNTMTILGYGDIKRSANKNLIPTW